MGKPDEDDDSDSLSCQFSLFGKFYTIFEISEAKKPYSLLAQII